MVVHQWEDEERRPTTYPKDYRIDLKENEPTAYKEQEEGPPAAAVAGSFKGHHLCVPCARLSLQHIQATTTDSLVSCCTVHGPIIFYSTFPTAALG